MRIDRSQTMTIPNEKRPKCKVQLYRRIVNVTKRSGKHGNAMKRYDSRRWSFVLFIRFAGGGAITVGWMNDLADLSVTREAQHHLI